jgi:hypothetical protein
VADTVSGGTTTGMYSTVGGATTGGVTTDDTNISGRAEEGRAGDETIAAGKGRIVTPETDGKYPEPDYTSGGTGSGAASNDRGANLHDIPTGTGSAARGNRAGVPDPNDGTITGGTIHGTSIEPNEAMRKAEEKEQFENKNPKTRRSE